MALVDPRRVGLAPTALSATVADHGPGRRESFTTGATAMPDLIEMWRINEQADFLLEVAVRDLAALDAFCHRLTPTIGLRGVSAQLALERVACITARSIDIEAPEVLWRSGLATVPSSEIRATARTILDLRHPSHSRRAGGGKPRPQG